MTEEELERFKAEVEALYGRDHDVPPEPFGNFSEEDSEEADHEG